ncbi:hypothetical protein DQ400_07615 [Vreelandella sulfidaeris]|uniref:Uncharacterized protein n=1 Tax=Vreelandella sulfidaeris TaxID=115553 RepID=A0A365TQL5_9GAMM|nr:hypothetical protein [Halomonas sulfidaeris]RBI68228.1 hypothetical protein DQ400_07615 [Halomonas sulfidaeris]
MPMNPTRRGLLRLATFAGIGALLLPGTTLLPMSQAAAPRLSPIPAPIMVKGWLLNASDC